MNPFDEKDRLLRLSRCSGRWCSASSSIVRFDWRSPRASADTPCFNRKLIGSGFNWRQKEMTNAIIGFKNHSRLEAWDFITTIAAAGCEFGRTNLFFRGCRCVVLLPSDDPQSLPLFFKQAPLIRFRFHLTWIQAPVPGFSLQKLERTTRNLPLSGAGETRSWFHLSRELAHQRAPAVLSWMAAWWAGIAGARTTDRHVPVGYLPSLDKRPICHAVWWLLRVYRTPDNHGAGKGGAIATSIGQRRYSWIKKIKFCYFKINLN